MALMDCWKVGKYSVEEYNVNGIRASLRALFLTPTVVQHTCNKKAPTPPPPG